MSFQKFFLQYMEEYYDQDPDSEYYPNEEEIMKILAVHDQCQYIKPLFDYITFFDKLIEKHNFGPRNRCIDCKEDMGRMNPRQYCGKSYCYKNLFS